MSDDTTLNEVEVDTDDLEAFDDLFHGRATVKSEASGDETKSEDDKSGDDTAAKDEQELDDTPAEEETSTEEETEESEGDGKEDEAEEAEEPAPKPKKKTAQERINELTAARREAERKATALEERLAALEAGNSKETKEEVKDLTPSPEDKNEDGTEKYALGEFDPAFIRDLTRFTIGQERELDRIATEERQKATKIDEANAKVNEVWMSEVTLASDKYEDFQESVATLEETFQSTDQQLSQYLADTIMQSEYGTDILYYLSQNIDEAQKIVDSGATKATLALGRLEANFATHSEKAPAAKTKVTKAKPVPNKRSRGSGSNAGVAADTDDLDAFERKFFNS